MHELAFYIAACNISKLSHEFIFEGLYMEHFENKEVRQNRCYVNKCESIMFVLFVNAFSIYLYIYTEPELKIR